MMPIPSQKLAAMALLSLMLGACHLSGNLYKDDTLFVRKEQQETQQKKLKPTPTPRPAVTPPTAKPAATPVPRPAENVKPAPYRAAPAPAQTSSVDSGLQSASGSVVSNQGRQTLDRILRQVDREGAGNADFVGARGELEALVVREPKFVEARTNLGVLFEKLNDALRAEQAYRQALADAPRYYPACQRLAELLSAQGRSDRSVEILRNCMPAGASKDESADLTLARFQLQQGNPAEALRIASDILRKNNDQIAAQVVLGQAFFDQGKLTQARAAFQRALPKSSGALKAEILSSLAFVSLREGNEPEATALWQQAINEDPHNLDAYGALGELSLRAGDGKRGEQIFKQLTQLDPQNFAFHLNLGVAERLKGDYRMAELEYLRALRLRPRSGEAMYNLGVLYQKHLKDPAKALVFLERYREADPRGFQTPAAQEIYNDAKRAAAKARPATPGASR